MNEQQSPASVTTPVTTPVVWSIREVIAWSSDFLKRRGNETARLDTELLLAHALGCKRLQLYFDIDKPLQQTEREAFKQLFKRRAASEPVAYILGEREFFGRAFAVDRRVLIPRPETELLIERVLADVGGKDAAATTKLNILDVGTGSGCIATTLACELAEASITACDVSAEALAVARVNAERHAVAARMRFLAADIFNAKTAFSDNEPYDIVVSNPPYIALTDPQLAASVRDFEPNIALFGGDDGLAFYRCLAVELRNILKPGGRIYLEIGYDQGAAILAMFSASGWRNLCLHQDLQGHDRVLTGVHDGN